jgi:ABC-2 type transport system permease protein
MNLSTFLKLELKNFLSGTAVVVAVGCLCLAGIYAMFHGKSVIDKQRAIIEKIPEFQAEHTAKQIELNKADLGNLLYYHQFSTIHEPSSWAAFSIGQRDVNPFNVKVKMLTLEGQLYDSEMSNPKNLLYGNLDLAFVIVFLFPLLIIAFCHNLISAEQENGVWNLLRSQPVSIGKIIGGRLLIRFVTVILIAFGLITASCFYLESSFDIRFIYALLITFSYLLFWFALTAFVISLQKSSTFNALSLLGVWIFLTILAPALLNLAISTALPVSESFELTVKQREGYHQKWDKAKSETMQKFYAKYPQFKDIPIPEDKFSWGWYYAAQLMGDLESGDTTANYMRKLKLRDEWTQKVALILPTVNAQLSFNRLSNNDLQSHLDYLESVRQHHTNVREYFYPFIFRNAKVEEVDWQNVPKHEFDDESKKNEFPASVLGIFIVSAIFAILAWRKLNGLLA